jgi:uncharacterized membrane protein
MEKDGTQAAAAVPGLAKDNIKAIMRIEKDFLRDRSWGEHFGTVVSLWAGNIFSTAAHFFFFAGWIVLNTGAVPGIAPFDPYPFGLLTVLISLEAIFLSLFVLMNQNRQAHQADHWAHLNLQIGLLSEQETTKILQILQQLSERLGLKTDAGDKELGEMVGKKSVGDLAEKLAEDLEKTRDPEHPFPD